jgi:hypothetical protein
MSLTLISKGRVRRVPLTPPARLADEADDAYHARTRWVPELADVRVEVVMLGRSELAALIRDLANVENTDIDRRIVARCVRGVTVSVETDDGVVDLSSGVEPERLAMLLDGVYLDGMVARAALEAQGITTAERDF